MRKESQDDKRGNEEENNIQIFLYITVIFSFLLSSVASLLMNPLSLPSFLLPFLHHLYLIIPYHIFLLFFHSFIFLSHVHCFSLPQFLFPSPYFPFVFHSLSLLHLHLLSFVSPLFPITSPFVFHSLSLLNLHLLYFSLLFSFHESCLVVSSLLGRIYIK